MKSPRFIFFKTVLPVLLAVLLIACNGSNAREKKEIEKRDVFLSADKIHEGWYFAAGDHIVIEGTINGDAYIAGQLIEIDGTINGDLIVAGRNLIINGTVSDDIRAAGELVNIRSQVGKNVAVAGREIILAKSANIKGNALAVGMNLHVMGTVGLNVRAAAKSMDIKGIIEGDVYFAGNDISIPEGAKVGGNLNVQIEKPENAEIADGTVHGKIDVSIEEKTAPHRILGFRSGHFKFKILWALGLIISAMLFVFLFPKQLLGIGESIARVPGQTIIWGLIGIIAVPFVIMLLFISILAIPLGFLLLTIYLGILYLSQLSLGIVASGRLFGLKEKRGWNLFWMLSIGVIIVQVLTFIPYLRPLIILAGLVLGFGAILLMLKNEIQKASGFHSDTNELS